MDKKYIVKNCPAIFNTIMLKNTCCDSDGDCKNNTDCLIKQVIEKCKDVSGYSDFAFGQRDKADEILKLFEIEEVDNG